jgi:hydroxymethylpyrimidine/phosphomethylpyrimidine kinase
MKVALTIGGSDTGGGAGIQADLKSFHTAGMHGTSAITAITAQNTQGVHRIYPLPLEEIKAQLDAILEDMDIGAAKTGMLYTSNVAELAAEKLRNVKLVVDPVLVSTTRHSLSTAELADAITTHLLPVCTVVTPNIEEAEQLTGLSIATLDDVRDACRALHELGAKAVVVTGGHLDEATDVYYDGHNLTTLTLPKQHRAAHGSGCTFSAFTAAFLARGLSIQKAVKLAKRYTWTAVAGVTGVATSATGLVGFAADIPALLANNLMAIGEVATVYGFDVADADERAYAMAVLFSQDQKRPGRPVAARYLREIAKALREGASWEDIRDEKAGQWLRGAARQLAWYLIKRKLAGIVPGIGSLVAGGVNAHFTFRSCSEARQVYRERFVGETPRATSLSDNGQARATRGGRAAR